MTKLEILEDADSKANDLIVDPQLWETLMAEYAKLSNRVDPAKIDVIEDPKSRRN